MCVCGTFDVSIVVKGEEVNRVSFKGKSSPIPSTNVSKWFEETFKSIRCDRQS